MLFTVELSAFDIHLIYKGIGEGDGCPLKTKIKKRKKIINFRVSISLECISLENSPEIIGRLTVNQL